MKGIEINSLPPEFLYTKLSDLKVELIGLTSKGCKGKSRADRKEHR